MTENQLISAAKAVPIYKNLTWSEDIEIPLRFCLHYEGCRPPSIHEFGSYEYLIWYVNKFHNVNTKYINLPKDASTQPDPVLDIIIERFYGIAKANLVNVSKGHRISMVGENLIGELLERYLASRITSAGWAWCRGEIVTGIDFIKARPDGTLYPLQIKNRSNSENSSSAKIRKYLLEKGVTVAKWYRVNANSGKTYWPSFPEINHNEIKLSEEDFHQFVRTVEPVPASSTES